MNEPNFEKMDKKMMDAMRSLRDQEVSDGMLKGFSASVERRLLAKKEPAASPRRFGSPVWIPVFAVTVLASLVVLRSPLMPLMKGSLSRTVDYAQLSGNKATDLEDEIAELKELGAWSEEDDSVLGNADDSVAQELELSSGPGGAKTNIA